MYHTDRSEPNHADGKDDHPTPLSASYFGTALSKHIDKLDDQIEEFIMRQTGNDLQSIEDYRSMNKFNPNGPDTTVIEFTYLVELMFERASMVITHYCVQHLDYDMFVEIEEADE